MEHNNKTAAKGGVVVSFVIPTLNSEETLGACLQSILEQGAPRSSYEIVIADGGSHDGTLALARTCGVDRVVENPLKTGEAGKAAGIKAAKGELIALVDSDNILPDGGWLERMLEPFEDPGIMFSEPLRYEWRKKDPALTRYFALLGMNDPVCLFTCNYDRYCYVTGRWTEVAVDESDRGGFIEVRLRPEALPTIGANGFIFRRSLLEKARWEPYFFDIDVVHQAAVAGLGRGAKVKVGIVHLYCSALRDFGRKQRRRIRDFLFFTEGRERTYPWENQSKGGIARFVLSTVTVVPLLLQMARGAGRRLDRAWWYHPVACWMTLWIYGWAAVRKVCGARQAPAPREKWGRG